MKYNLRNSELQALANKHGDLPSIEDMQADLALVRAFCEMIANGVEDSSKEELVHAFQLVGPALLQLHKAQESVLRLGVATDQLVTKEALRTLCNEVVNLLLEVLRKHVTEEHVCLVVDELAPRMGEAIDNVRNSPRVLENKKLIEHQGE